MCDDNQCNQMNFQQFDPCEMSYDPQMENQSMRGCGDEKQYCPPSCNQCTEQQQVSPNNFVCYDPNQNCYVDYQPEQQTANFDQCYENLSAENCEMSQQKCDYQPMEAYCPPNYCAENCVPSDDPNEHSANCCPCPEKCRMPMCSPFQRQKYIQPQRTKSCKPIICYQKPSIPISTDTIYRKSFECVDPATAACCRLPMVRPRGYLRSPDGALEKETVTKLSFQPYCKVERTKPIIPQSPSLLGKGPIQGMTTQKHDFVPKFQYRRSKINPRDNIKKMCGCVEKTTVQRLSFMPPCVNERRPSCKPIINYKKPEIPMEFETTQKLSFMPVCPAPREDHPWARKAKYQPPSVGFANDTVTKLSYQPPGCFVNECFDPCLNQYYSQMSRAEC